MPAPAKPSGNASPNPSATPPSRPSYETTRPPSAASPSSSSRLVTRPSRACSRATRPTTRAYWLSTQGPRRGWLGMLSVRIPLLMPSIGGATLSVSGCGGGRRRMGKRGGGGGTIGSLNGWRTCRTVFPRLLLFRRLRRTPGMIYARRWTSFRLDSALLPDRNRQRRCAPPARLFFSLSTPTSVSFTRITTRCFLFPRMTSGARAESGSCRARLCCPYYYIYL